MNPLASKLLYAFSSFPDRPAVELAEKSLTYAELEGAAWACAGKLNEATAPGSRVGLLAQRSLGAYVGVAAAVLSGHPYVPINPKFPANRQRAIAAAAGCAAFLFDTKSEETAQSLAEEFGGRPIEVDADARADPDTAAEGRHAYVMFTSGTTGTPKGVAVRYDNVSSYVDAFGKVAQVLPTDRCTQLFDLSFDLSVHDMFVTWANGACLCVPSDDELIDPVGFAVRNRTTCWFSVPSLAAVAKRMRRLQPNSLPEVRLSLFCGEALPKSLAQAWSEAAPNSEIWNLYGPTEATIAITAFKFDPAQEGEMPATVPLGQPYANCDVSLVDAAGTPVGVGQEGELWLAGAQLTDGYINNPEEQEAKFVSLELPGSRFSSWYRSGDLVRSDPTWGLVYQSRIDDQVKISGYRVELFEIEEALREAAENPDVAVIPWPISEAGSASGVVAFVANLSSDPREIISRCRKVLPSYCVPKQIIEVDALPVNANGKVDRKALRSQHLESKNAG